MRSDPADPVGGVVRAARGALALVFVGGALALLTACPTVDLGDTPPDIGVCRPNRAYFESDIWPKLIAPEDEARSCVAASGCHQAESGRSALRLTTDPPDFDRNYAVVTRFLNCGTPESSQLLTKPMSGIEQHGGGDLFGPDDPVVADFDMWFTP